jgi:hypothetical protein
MHVDSVPFSGYNISNVETGSSVIFPIQHQIESTNPNNLTVRTNKLKLLSAHQKQSAGSAVSMNGYVVLFHKTCVWQTLQHYSYTQGTVLWRLLERNVFGTGVGGARMRSKILLSPPYYFPADLPWSADIALCSNKWASKEVFC